MNKYILTGLMFSSVLLLGACTNEVIKEVNVVESSIGDITKTELYEEMKERHGDSVLKAMLDEMLLTEAYPLPEEEFINFKEQFQIKGEFQKYLDSYDMTEMDLKKEMEFSYAYDKALRESAGLTDEKLTEFIENNPDLFYQIEASQILVETSGVADQVVAELERGDSFEDVASKHSIHPSADYGGHLGYFAKGSLIPALERTAFSLGKGETSKPIATDTGHYIIKVHEARVLNLTDNRAEVEQIYLNEHGPIKDDFMENLETKYKVKIRD